MFKNAGDANEAFKQLPGARDTDSFGRAQKQLKLTAGTAHYRHVLSFLLMHAVAAMGGTGCLCSL